MTEARKPTCDGCRNDFYNGNNELGVKKCWSKKTAKVVARYRIHRDTVPTRPNAFTKVRVFDCYHGPPWFYDKELPDFVKPKDVRSQ